MPPEQKKPEAKEPVVADPAAVAKELEALRAQLGDAQKALAEKDEALSEAQAKLEAAEEAAKQAPVGVAFMDHEDEKAGATFDGVELARGPNGLFLVPKSAVEQLEAHGFKLAGEPAEAEAE